LKLVPSLGIVCIGGLIQFGFCGYFADFYRFHRLNQWKVNVHRARNPWPEFLLLQPVAIIRYGSFSIVSSILVCIVEHNWHCGSQGCNNDSWLWNIFDNVVVSHLVSRSLIHPLTINKLFVKYVLCTSGVIGHIICLH
jgi:hypothetical protein